MKLLLDTHLLIWTATNAKRVSVEARRLIEDPDNDIVFSLVSLWEIAIKRSLGRPDFQIDPREFRTGLLAAGFDELPLKIGHCVAVIDLPFLHRDPFDRMMIAQARTEAMTFVSADRAVSRYPGVVAV